MSTRPEPRDRAAAFPAGATNEAVSPHETRLTSTKQPTMARWRQRLFRWLLGAEERKGSMHGLPTDRVVEVDVPIEL